MLNKISGEIKGMSDMTSLENYKIHPKAGRLMALVMFVSLALTYFGKHNNWSDTWLYISSLPATFCVCVFVAQDIRIWKKQE